MDDLETRLRARLVALKQARDSFLGQLNAASGAIGEIEAILNGAPAVDPVPAETLAEPTEEYPS